MFKYLLNIITIGLLFIHLTIFADSLNATVDRTALSSNETVMLTLTFNGSPNGKSPNWHILDKDFTRLGNSTNQQLAIINGKMSQITAWTIVLAPKHEGEITIPPIEIEKLKSDAITIQVDSVKQILAQGKAPTIFLQAKIEPKQAYVQQQIVYTVSLYHNEAILSGGFSAPELPNAIIKQLGSDSQYQTKLNEHTYQVIERHYVIFPQVSGKMTLNPSLFGGTIAAPITRDDLLNDSTFIGRSTKPVQLRADSIELDIKPKPNNFNSQQWLPAKALSLKESWSTEPLIFRVGEPITLTLTLHAQGLSADQLPIITIPALNNLNIYPGRPALTTNSSSNDVVGIREQKIVLIPAKPGKLELPAITLNWWNTQTNHAETINIPAQTFNVLPALNTQSNNEPAPAVATAIVKQTTQHSAAINAATTPLSVKKSFNYWPWIMAILFFIAWIVTLGLWLMQKRNSARTTTDYPVSKTDSLGHARKQLHQACNTNHPAQAKEALIAWAKIRWPNTSLHGLIDIGEQVNSIDLKSAIKELDRLLYSSEQAKWDGAKFWQLFQNEPAKTPRNQSDKGGGLPPLYPR